jgi:predicted SprT family Zn-dependent metalloprotease
MDETFLIEHLPSVHELFIVYDGRHFNKNLSLNGVLVEWSDRMKRCAGICYYRNNTSIIRLSRPLLSLKPFSETINTLLHEMIHAYNFVRGVRDDSFDGHGTEFINYMDRINQIEGTKITVRHTFYDEVKFYQKHRWRCNGPCRDMSPFFGWVNRSMNRAPSPKDWWFSRHQTECGGTFIKFSESGDKEVTTNINFDGGKEIIVIDDD